MKHYLECNERLTNELDRTSITHEKNIERIKRIRNDRPSFTLKKLVGCRRYFSLNWV